MAAGQLGIGTEGRQLADLARMCVQEVFGRASDSPTAERSSEHPGRQREAPLTAMLAEQVKPLRSQLGLSGTDQEVLNQAAEKMGIHTTGRRNAEIAAMCMQALLSTDLQLQGAGSGGSAATSSASTRRGLAILTATELYEMTRKFSEARLIGKGGFGAVYAADSIPKLDLACSCAVKVLSVVSNQGVEESKNEARLLGELRHQNLMPLLGCCEEMGHEALVFPLMKGGDFFDRLHCRKSSKLLHDDSLVGAIMDSLTPRTPLDWKQRMYILRDAMRGLDYLHEMKWLHRDVKPQNILLDEHLHARLADVGFASQAISNSEAHEGKPHGVSSMMHISTPGFIDPLISNLGQYSEETDGYAMGMTILIAHGCKPSTEEDLKMLECILEEPTSAPGHADAKAGYRSRSLLCHATKRRVALSASSESQASLALTQLKRWGPSVGGRRAPAGFSIAVGAGRQEAMCTIRHQSAWHCEK